MGELARHLVTTLRSLGRQPAVTVPVVLTLALGIGANTALFANFLQIFWPTFDAPHPERVVYVYMGTVEQPQQPTSYPDFQELQRQQQAVTDLISYSAAGASLGVGDQTTFVWQGLVSGGYFQFFALRPALGRLLQPDDDRPGADPVVVLSHRFWQSTLGGDPAILGQLLRINAQTFTVVGVAPAGFTGAGGLPPDLFAPLIQADRVTGLPRLARREGRWVNVLGRLSPGVPFGQAQAALASLGHALDESMPLTDKRSVTAVRATGFDPDPEGTSGNPFIAASRVLMAAALLFLLLGCASVANLLLARSAARQREWGIRASLGASRTRLAGAALLESLLLCLAGGVAGLPIARLLAHRMGSYLVTGTAGIGDLRVDTEVIQLDHRALLFSLLAALLCSLLAGLGPVLRVAHRDLLAPLKSDAAGTGTPARALAARRLLLVAQVALSVLLLLGGGLLMHSLSRAAGTDPGFSTDRMLLASVFVPRQVAEDKAMDKLYARVLDAVRAVPGVTAASMSQVAPLSGWMRESTAASGEQPDRKVPISYTQVGPGYFTALGIPILEGRALDEHDRHDTQPAVVISQALAQKLWPGESALGRSLTLADPPRAGDLGPVFTVVGVSRDVRVKSMVEEPGPVLFVAHAQRMHPRMTIVARTGGPPLALAQQLRRALRDVSPDLSVVDLMTCREQISRSLGLPRMYAEVAGLFGLLGLVVAVAGLFGLLSYSVTLRGRELGIRMAVGARPVDVRRLVVRQGMTMVGVGVALGLAAAPPLTRLLASLLFGVGALDPVTFVAVPLVLALVALLACELPARRAARVDPAVVLRAL